MNQTIEKKPFLVAVPEMLHRPATRRQWCGGAAIVLLCASVLFAFTIPLADFHGDEAGWIPASLQTAEWVLSGETDPDVWIGHDLSTYGNLNPPVGKLMIGLPLLAWQRVFFPSTEANGMYDWRLSIQANIMNGRVPPLPMLYAARAICAFHGLLVCLMLYAIATWAFRVEIGVLAVFVTIINPVFLEQATNAMTDMPFMVWVTGAGLILMAMMRARRSRTIIGLAAACGGMAAMAYSVKITGLILIAFLFLAALLLRPRPERRPWWTRAGAVVAFGALATFLPIAINPFFWPALDQIDGAALRAELDQLIDPEKRAALPAAEKVWAMYERRDFNRALIQKPLPQLANLSRPLEMPLLFIRWRTFMDSLADKAEQDSGRTRPGAGEIIRHISLNYAPFPGSALFLLLGLGALVFHAVNTWPLSRGNPGTYPLLSFFVNFLFLCLFMRVPWDRYFLSVLLPSHMLVAAGLFVPLRALGLRLKPGIAFLVEALLAVDGEADPKPGPQTAD